MTMEGEVIILSDDEKKLLARGPKYCLLKSCSEEAMLPCCSIEVEICKHKWDCLFLGGGSEGEQAPREQLSEEDRPENEHVLQLSEEIAAEAREVFDHRNKVFNMGRKRVTDYRKNSCVILARAQTANEESKLEILRMGGQKL